MADCELKLRVTPRASRNAVVGERTDSIAVKLTAAPVKGAANKALLSFLSDKLNISRGSISIVGGETAREKRVHIDGLTLPEARARLLA